MLRARIGIVVRSLTSSMLSVTAGILPAFAGPATGRSAEVPPELLEHGSSLYRSLCLRCHGETGDDLGYPGILPLAGIDRRIGSGEIAVLSAPFVGRVFEGDDARALVAYLGTLGGEKGFAEPGFVFSPYLLDRKHGDLHSYRVVDVRPKSAYDEGHVGNAVHWPFADQPEAPETQPAAAVAEAMAELGIGPGTFVVVYDEEGGPKAASVWWSLLRAGHERVALLDGGWRGWREAGHAASKGRPRIETAPLRQPSPPRAPDPKAPGDGTRVLRLGSGPEGPEATRDEVRIDWEKTVAGGVLRDASGIATYLAEAGLKIPGRYRIEGPRRDLGSLVFLLSVLGKDVDYEPGDGVLSVR